MDTVVKLRHGIKSSGVSRIKGSRSGGQRVSSHDDSGIHLDGQFMGGVTHNNNYNNLTIAPSMQALSDENSKKYTQNYGN